MILPVSAVAISQSHHRAIVIAFILGYLLHALGQVDAASRATHTKRWHIIEENWIRILVRGFGEMWIFLWLWYDPSSVLSVLKLFHINLGVINGSDFVIPIIPPTAGLIGLCADTLVTFMPWAKNVVPPPVDTKPPIPPSQPEPVKP